MNKAEMISRVSRNTGFSVSVVSPIVENLLDSITETLSSGESVGFRGFGKFEVSQRAKRVARNPRNNTEVSVPEKVVPRFLAGIALKSRVAEGNLNND